MNPQTVLAVAQAAAALLQLAPQIVEIGTEIRDQLSTDDQAKLDASLAVLKGERQADVAQAEAALEAAAGEA